MQTNLEKSDLLMTTKPTVDYLPGFAMFASPSLFYFLLLLFGGAKYQRDNKNLT